MTESRDKSMAKNGGFDKLTIKSVLI